MSIVNLIKTAVASIKAHKLRVFLTMIGIIIGISSVVTILSIGNGLKVEVSKSFEETDSNKYVLYYSSEDSNTNMNAMQYFYESDIGDISKIEGIDRVEEAQGMMMGFSFSTAEMSYFDKRLYTFIDSFNDKTLKIEEGRSYYSGEENKKVIILSHDNAKEMFGSSKEAIGKGVSIGNEIFEVIGVMAKSSGIAITPPSNYISKEFMTTVQGDTAIYQLDVYLEANVNKENILSEINNMLKINHPNLNGEYKFEDSQAVTKAFEQIIGGVTSFVALVTGISLFVGGIGVMNIMYVSVSERKREIGIRRAIGAKPISILLQFLIEAVIVTSIGGIIGIGMGYLFGNIASAFLPFPAVMSVSSFLGATLISVIVGIVFGIIPAYKASKMDPIKAIYN